MNSRHALLNLTLAAALTLPGATHASGIPTIDIAAVMEQAQQTTQLIRQYQTQLKQYEVMLRNSASPPTFVWDDAQRTMARLREATDTLRRIRSDIQGVDAYLNQFGDLAQYRAANSASAKSADPAFVSKAQQAANGAALKAVDLQQTALEDDARQLTRLQSAAQGASGQLQAIQFANQLASQQATQLLQVRALLNAQLQALAVQQAAQADEQARRKAATESALRPAYRKSEPKAY